MTTKGEDGSYVRVPRADELKIDPAAAYVHLTSNETIHGVQFHAFPDTGSVPLVCDMSSDILWKPIDVSKFGVIYAGAQKNLGPSGVVVVILRKDLVAKSPKTIPTIFRYSTHAKNDSLYNTAPTFGIYMLRNVLAWVASEGGAAGMEARNARKAAMLYGAIDENAGFFRCPVEKGSRSTMNVVFRLPSEALEEKFVSEAKKAAGIVGIKGHRSVGGIRISMYNAVDPGSVETLVGFMRDFAKTNG
jgi:phosphoserine aminotransferase